MVFESLFPGQIEHAEMLIDTSKLEEVLRKRRRLIDKYDDIDARYRYACWRYSAWQRDGKLVGCGSNTISEPEEPTVCPISSQSSAPSLVLHQALPNLIYNNFYCRLLSRHKLAGSVQGRKKMHINTTIATSKKSMKWLLKNMTKLLKLE